MAQVIAITDDLAANAGRLASAEILHRQLRPNIPHPYAEYMRRMFSEGAEMAILVEADAVRAAAVYRCHHTTFHGYRFYLDDLITDEQQRARGYGSQMMGWCEERARQRSCDVLDLESGTQRQRTHKFYFRHNLGIFAFGFTKPLKESPAL
jgi:GNAT superfamily N-acetyltransferase